ncbi:MAG: DUF4169 family protein [Minwuia sp.]|nr:DUF4169 family protein [Minwuia sp.]
MADLINLRRERKNRDRKAKAERAAENRILFGRTDAERRRHETESNRRRLLLDGKRLAEGETEQGEG